MYGTNIIQVRVNLSMRPFQYQDIVSGRLSGSRHHTIGQSHPINEIAIGKQIVLEMRKSVMLQNVMGTMGVN
jgi:hypothetical protein